MECLGNNVVIVREKSADVERGIVLPDSAKKESKRGQVVCAGPECKRLKVGDKILVPLLTMMRVMQTGAFDLEYEGEPALVVKEEDVAVVWTSDMEDYEEKPQPRLVTGLAAPVPVGEVN